MYIVYHRITFRPSVWVTRKLSCFISLFLEFRRLNCFYRTQGKYLCQAYRLLRILYGSHQQRHTNLNSALVFIMDKTIDRRSRCKNNIFQSQFYLVKVHFIKQLIFSELIDEKLLLKLIVSLKMWLLRQRRYLHVDIGGSHGR